MKTNYFFIRKNVKICQEGMPDEISQCKIGIIVLAYEDNILEISGAICSPKDNFNRNVAKGIAFGRLNSTQEKHVVSTTKDIALSWSFDDLIRTHLQFCSEDYGDVLTNHIYNRKIIKGDGKIIKTAYYTIDYDKHTKLFKDVIYDITGGDIL